MNKLKTKNFIVNNVFDFLFCTMFLFVLSTLLIYNLKLKKINLCNSHINKRNQIVYNYYHIKLL